jgi:hypothetical protein
MSFLKAKQQKQDETLLVTSRAKRSREPTKEVKQGESPRKVALEDPGNIPLSHPPTPDLEVLT